jgi:hypothetical protein
MDDLYATTWGEQDKNDERDESTAREGCDNQKDKQDHALSSRKVPKTRRLFHREWTCPSISIPYLSMTNPPPKKAAIRIKLSRNTR